jgi:multicopper oxidase
MPIAVRALAIPIALALLTACQAGADGGSRLALVRPRDPAVEEVERARRVAGATEHRVTLTAAPTTLTVAGKRVATWAFNGTVPGPDLRLVAGDTLHATVVNRLPEGMSVHWHGVVLRNDRDGVAGVTQQPIPPGGSFTYSFVVPDPGTFWYHPHAGLQLDRGLYGALVVSERGPASATRDVAVLLDDWTDGLAGTPEQVLQRLGGLQVPHNHQHGTRAGAMPTAGSGAVGDVRYPAYLANGRSPEAVRVYDVQPRERVRLRLVNSAADTAFRVAVGGARMTAVATDGHPVVPVTVDTVSIAMGERYDVELTAPAAGVLPVVALPEGKSGRAQVVLRVGKAQLPQRDVRPSELDGTALTLADLHATDGTRLPEGTPDRTYRVTLAGGTTGYSWGMEVPERDGVSLPVRQGERIRLVLVNPTMMSHPMHLHGHAFQVLAGGARKDTVLVPAMDGVTVELVADNPGQWMLHCHNTYHAATGMVALLSYVH